MSTSFVDFLEEPRVNAAYQYPFDAISAAVDALSMVSYAFLLLEGRGIPIGGKEVGVVKYECLCQ
jgi:hypothetical protein